MNLEAEYNNRAKVPEHQAIIDRWERDAAAFRAAWTEAELGLAYGPTPRQVMDLFWPAAAHDAPLALFIHGGYWQGGDRARHSHVAAGLLAHGVAVALPSYDLCPQVSLAQLTAQVRAAAAFLARRHGRGMLATGHSAGGHLAALLLATDWGAHNLPAATVAAALPVSGLFDLAPLRHTTVNTALGLDEAEARRLSPMLLPRPAGARLHAVVGGDEGAEYKRQSSGIAAAWGGTWEAVAGRNHFTIVDTLADPESPIVRTAIGLLSS